MKKLIFLIAAVAFSHLITFSQGCLPEGITFTSQAQIDSFQIIYPGCTEIGGEMTIEGWTDVTNLNGLINITKIQGGLTISANYYLSDLEGLNNLDSIGGDLTLGSGCMWWGNYALTSLHGLENLTYIGGSLHLSDDQLLIDFSGLDNLTAIDGDLGIFGCINLLNLNGLDNLTTLGGSFMLDGNNLNSLTGLDKLTCIGGSLIIGHLHGTGSEDCPEDNPNLSDISSLTNLTTINGELQISNTSLKSLSGLENIDAGSISDLYIYSNDSLSICVIQSICNYLAAPNGTIDIHNNAPGCNSQAEVEDACGIIGMEEIPINNGFTIYPNPSTSQITIETSAAHIPVQLTILNLSGQQLMQRRVTEPRMVIDISQLPGGVYIVRITNDRMVETTRLIKQ
jgi:hypothetical protein